MNKRAMDAAAKATKDALASARGIGWPREGMSDRGYEIEARLIAEAAVAAYLVAQTESKTSATEQ